nr:esterase [Quercus suber]
MAFMEEPTDAGREKMRQSSINVTKYHDRSLYMFLLQHLLSHISGKLLSISEKDEYPPGSPQLDPHKKAKKRCDIHGRQVEGVWLYDVVPKGSNPEKKYSKRMYYFAGGGWHSPASSDHWALIAELAVKVPDLAVCLVSYPLAPNSPAPKAFPVLQTLYDALLKESERSGEGIIMAGDSAGGNIILSLAIDALHQDPTSPVPTALLAISPSTDLSRSNPEIAKVAAHDPLLKKAFIEKTAAQWRGEWDAKDPRISPVYADVSMLAQRGVKVHGVIGGYDMLGPDVVRFREKLREAGVKGEWLDWDKQIHVFPLMWAYHLREGVQSKDWIVDVLTNA